MLKQDYGFICELCGRLDLVPSIIKLDANYGSEFDGERISLCLCGKCMDRIFKMIKHTGGN